MAQDAYFQNKMHIDALVQMLKSYLVPLGLPKMAVDRDVIMRISQDGDSILDNMGVEHAGVRMLAEARTAVFKEVGDRTLSTVILVGNFSSECKEHIRTVTFTRSV